jgi:polar amino acid transport system substrate-binding protein
MSCRNHRFHLLLTIVLLLTVFLRNPLDAAVAAEQPARLALASTNDLAGKKIGVLLGSIHDSFATKTYPTAQILQFDNGSDLTLAVSTGKVDAALSDAEPLAEILRTHDELAILGEPLLSLPVGAGFNLNNVALRQAFDDFLAELRAQGVLDDMVGRWIRTHDTRMPAITVPNATGVLNVGTAIGGLPFGAIQTNELVGFDIELTTRFAAKLGKRVHYAQMPFASLIAATATGKVDMIVASIFITDERKQRIAFSAPYYATTVRAYALKSNLAGASTQPGSADAPPPPSFMRKLSDSFENNLIKEQRYLLIWDGLKITALISVLATLFGTVLGGLVCFMRMSPRWFLSLPARIYISILRGMPVVVLLMLIFYVVFASVDISPVIVAVIAFGMNFAAYVSEMFRSGIASIDKGQSEAGTAMGFSRVETFRLIVLPQMIQRILPVYKGEFISLVKMTSIVGYIAVQDLTKAGDIVRSRTFDAFFPLVMVAVLYFFISWVLMQALEYVERATDPRHRRRKAGGQ